MSGENKMDQSRNEQELWMDLQDLEAGTIDPGRREALMERLQGSQAARRSYFEFFQQSAILKMEGAKLHERGLLPVVDSNMRQRRLFQRSLLAAAALLILSGAIFALVRVTQPAPRVLRVAVAADTRWAVDGQVAKRSGNNLEVGEGATVRVLSGTVRLELESGALMVIQGPALASFPSLNRPVLRQGWLWVDSDSPGEGFEITTPDLIVRDIGTRFAVRVPPEGPTEVHVLEGEVVALPKGGGPPLASLKPDGKGYEIRADGTLVGLDLARDPFPELSKLLAALPAYRTTVQSQSPVAYWEFDFPKRGPAPTRATDADETPAQVFRGEPGVGARGIFQGFEKDNTSLRLLGKGERSVVAGLGGPHGVSRKEGAVSFWIRRLPGIAREEVLWLAGTSPTRVNIWPELNLLHTSLTPSGRVRFSIENGENDVILSSSRSIADGNWHHIVASWGPSSVDLYVDGWRSASDREARELREAETSGSYVRFGKPSANLAEQGAGAFSGWTDEIALWNRPLTHTEVAHQYQSAKGAKQDHPE